MRTMKILLVLVLIVGLTLPVTAVAGPGKPILPTGEDEDGGNSISYPVIWADTALDQLRRLMSATWILSGSTL